MKITTSDVGNTQVTYLIVAGSIDEDSVFPSLELKNELVLDLEAVERINSCGIREWINWVKKIPTTTKVSLINCPKAIVDQVNNVDGFIPPQAKVVTFFAPYYCEVCGNMTMIKLSAEEIVAKGKSAIPTHTVCEKCKKPAERDFAVTKYLKFLGHPL